MARPRGTTEGRPESLGRSPRPPRLGLPLRPEHDSVSSEAPASSPRAHMVTAAAPSPNALGPAGERPVARLSHKDRDAHYVKDGGTRWPKSTGDTQLGCVPIGSLVRPRAPTPVARERDHLARGQVWPRDVDVTAHHARVGYDDGDVVSDPPESYRLDAAVCRVGNVDAEDLDRPAAGSTTRQAPSQATAPKGDARRRAAGLEMPAQARWCGAPGLLPTRPRLCRTGAQWRT